MPASPTPRVLLLRRRYLADVVALTAVTRNLRRHWPNAECVVACESRFAEALALAPDPIAAVAWPTSWTQWIRCRRHGRRAGFTHVIDFEGTRGSAFLARGTRAAVRLAAPDGPVVTPRAYTETAPSAALDSTLAGRFLRALPAIGVPPGPDEVRLEPRAADVAALARYVGASPRVLLVHPGAKDPSASWPAEKFAALIDTVQDELETQVVLDGGPRDGPLVAEIRARVRTHLMPVPGGQTVARFAALARLSHAVFGPTGGLMHVAAAVGTPVVALTAGDAVAPAGNATTRWRTLATPAPGGDASTSEAFTAVREFLVSPRRFR
jgi:heptosyltransferase-3